MFMAQHSRKRLATPRDWQFGDTFVGVYFASANDDEAPDSASGGDGPGQQAVLRTGEAAAPTSLTLYKNAGTVRRFHNVTDDVVPDWQVDPDNVVTGPGLLNPNAPVWYIDSDAIDGAVDGVADGGGLFSCSSDFAGWAGGTPHPLLVGADDPNIADGGDPLAGESGQYYWQTGDNRLWSLGEGWSVVATSTGMEGDGVADNYIYAAGEPSSMAPVPTLRVAGTIGDVYVFADDGDYRVFHMTDGNGGEGPTVFKYWDSGEGPGSIWYTGDPADIANETYYGRPLGWGPGSLMCWINTDPAGTQDDAPIGGIWSINRGTAQAPVWHNLPSDFIVGYND